MNQKWNIGIYSDVRRKVEGGGGSGYKVWGNMDGIRRQQSKYGSGLEGFQNHNEIGQLITNEKQLPSKSGAGHTNDITTWNVHHYLVWEIWGLSSGQAKELKWHLHGMHACTKNSPFPEALGAQCPCHITVDYPFRLSAPGTKGRARIASWFGKTSHHRSGSNGDICDSRVSIGTGLRAPSVARFGQPVDVLKTRTTTMKLGSNKCHKWETIAHAF